MKSLTIIFILFAQQLVAQEKEYEKKLINTVELTFEFGLGGGAYGLQLKANHWWLDKGTFILQSGVSLGIFYGSEKASNPTTTGYNFDTHLRFYSGVQQYFSNRQKGFYNFEVYGGSYHVYTKGNVRNPYLNIDSDFKSGKILGDFGTRLGYGYQFSEKLKTLIAITTSWRQVGSDYNPFIRFLSMEPDAKTSIGLGVNYGL